MNERAKIAILLLLIGFLSWVLDELGILVYPRSSVGGTQWEVGNIMFTLFFVAGIFLLIIPYKAHLEQN